MTSPEPYICTRCQVALASGIDHFCPEWGNADGSPTCECPDHETWCDDCQDSHHPPVSANYEVGYDDEF